MPFECSVDSPQPDTSWQVTLWPYRSLLRRDFVIFMGATAALIALPMVALLGTFILWGLLPFFVVVFAGLWYALQLSYRRGETREDLTVTEVTVSLTHAAPNRAPLHWRANRHWASIHLHQTDGPVENYLTMRGGDREVELGRFLDAAERLALYDLIKRAL